MASIADVARGASLTDYLANLQRVSREADNERDAMRARFRTNTRAELPGWRIDEHNFYLHMAWERLISARPGPAKSQSREWASYGHYVGRVQARATVAALDPDTKQPYMRIRNVGPRDALCRPGHVPSWRVTVPSPAVHITFPDWV